MKLKAPRWLVRWLWRRALKRPAGDISSDGSTYMRRWWLLHYDDNPFGIGIRLHQIMRGDADRELHDHPWWNVSWLLEGGYFEELLNDSEWRPQGSIVFRKATTWHRIETDFDEDGNEKPVTSLFIMGPYSNAWGFLRGGVKVPWRNFLSDKAFRKTGCGHVVLNDGKAFCAHCGYMLHGCPLEGKGE